MASATSSASALSAIAARRLRLCHARAGGGPILHHQDPDGDDGMAGRDGARDAGPRRRTIGEAASGADLVRPGGDDHTARLCVYDGYAEGQHTAVFGAGGILPGPQEARG